MLLQKRNSLVLLCMLLACCQEVDLTEYSKESTNSTPTETPAENVTVLGTGEGTAEHPYMVEHIRSMSLSDGETVWVIGYLVGTAPTSMNNAVFNAEAKNQSNILLSSDSLCSDTACCIPVELSSEKWKKSLSLPMNVVHFRKCLLVQGVPTRYLYNRKGLRKVSAGLWLDGFDIASVAPLDWSPIEIPF